jgi:hypothetical protein
MAGYFTSDTLVADIKRRAMIPTNQLTFTKSDFLAFANSEIDQGLVPMIISIKEEYYVSEVEYPLVANKSKYPIPYRAVGGKLRNIFYQDTNGALSEMTRISPSDIAFFQSTSSGTDSRAFAYYIQGNDIVLIPSVSANPTGSILMKYYLRPSDLVEENKTAVITNIAVGVSETVFTVANIPTGMTGSSVLDINQAKSGHKIINYDITPSSINTTNKTITFLNADVATDIVVGDHINFAGECIIPQIPSDLHPVLSQRVAARCLEALGDQAGLASANTKLQEMEVNSGKLIDNRVEGSPQKVNNLRGILRSSKVRRGWF